MGIILTYEDLLTTYKTRTHRIRHLKDYTHLFPINANETLAGIVADLMGDGNLQKTPVWRIDFTSKDLEELKRFETEMLKNFNINGKIRPCSTNKYHTYNIGFNCAPVARILYLAGVPAGQKVLQKFDLPNWIKEDKDYFRRFCQRLFTCEGSINYELGRNPRVGINMWKCEEYLNQGRIFFEDISDLMKKYFDIDSKVSVGSSKNLRKDGIITRPVYILIPSKSTLIFHKKIGFEGEKQNRLSNILNTKV
ncbi:MAG: hypothetical protein AABW71_00590 [Nanoarchaeota archaeon]